MIHHHINLIKATPVANKTTKTIIITIGKITAIKFKIKPTLLSFSFESNPNIPKNKLKKENIKSLQQHM